MNRLIDSQLVADYLAGDEESLEILIRSYLKPIYGFVYKYVGNEQNAEDVTQEVFIKVWSKLKRFDQRKSFKTWIFSIAKNTCIDLLRKRKTIPFTAFENEEGENQLIETLSDPAPLANEVLERSDITETINAAINQLTLKYRMVLSSRYDGDLSFKEISESLGEPLHTIKSRHRRALIKLKHLLPES